MAFKLTLIAAANDRAGIARALQEIIKILNTNPFEDNGNIMGGRVYDVDWNLEQIKKRPRRISVLDI